MNSILLRIAIIITRDMFFTNVHKAVIKSLPASPNELTSSKEVVSIGYPVEI